MLAMALDRKTCRNCQDYTAFWNQLGFAVYCDTCLKLMRANDMTGLAIRATLREMPKPKQKEQAP